LLLRAGHGAISRFDIDWRISEAEGNLIILSDCIARGIRMVWADETQRPDWHAERVRRRNLRALLNRFGF